MQRILKFAIHLVLVVTVGSIALGASLTMLVPAGRELTTKTAAYGSVLPELSTLAQRSIVYDAEGRVAAVLFAEEDRAPIDLDAMPDHLLEAVLAVEDRNFYEHDGIDVKGLLRALLRNVETGGVREGGSTVTQQLVKIGLIGSAERTVERKVREAILARRLENELTKDEILERYLNQVYFGQGAYGVRAAAERYFDKQPADLEVFESALLAGLIANPEGANPITQPDRALRRRAEVLDSLHEIGYLEYEAAEYLKLLPLPRPDTTFGVNNPRPDGFYIEEVKRRLLRDERLGETYQERYQNVFRGGLRIYTAYDPAMQAQAEAAVRDTLPETEFTAALAAIDNETGAVLALVGGESFSDEQFNLATQSIRQTGSSFKTIALAAALDLGYSPDDTISASSPCSFDLPYGQVWTIRSPGGGTMSLRQATIRSINCAYARLTFAVTPEAVVDMADRLGIDTSRMEPFPSITLGTQGTPVLDMAEAYSVFAADGVHREPMFVTRVEGPDGEVIFEEDQAGEQVIEVNTARTITEILEAAVTSGTGTSARLADRRAAGKTGTTDDFVDALFVGYTPQITTAVWMGHPARLIPMRNVGSYSRVFGGTYPALIFKAFMDAVHEGRPALDFEDPDPSLYPPRTFVDEDGRREGGRTRTPTAPAAPPTPTTAPPTTTTTAAPEPTPTTAPPTTTTTAPPTTTTTAPPTTTTTAPPTTTTTAPPPDDDGG